MDKEDVTVCCSLVGALQILHDVRAVPVLAEFLDHPDASIVSNAAHGLRSLGDPAGETIRVAVAQALIGLRETPRPLRELKLLGILGTADCTTAVAIRACDPDTVVRASAIAALGSLPLRPEQCMAVAEMLLEGVSDPESNVRRAAVQSLTEENMKAAVAHMCSQRGATADEARSNLLVPLVQAMDDEDERVRSAAIAALKRLSRADAKEPVTAVSTAPVNRDPTGTQSIPQAVAPLAFQPSSEMNLSTPDASGISPVTGGSGGVGTTLSGSTREHRHTADADLMSLWTTPGCDWTSPTAAVLTAVAIRAAIDAGANTNIVDAKGKTALMKAVWLGHTESIHLLLESNADMNIRDEEGWPALMVAAKSGRAEIAWSLWKAGATTTFTDNAGRSILWHAQNPAPSVSDGAKNQTVDVLQEAFNDALISLWEGDGYSSKWKAPTPDVVQALLEAGADANAADSEGRTVLMRACKHGQAEVVELLLKAEADVNTGNYPNSAGIMTSGELGWTALMFAASGGHTDIACLLLDADANLTDSDYVWTALMHAAGNVHPDVVRLLLGASADPNVADDENGRTALMEAAEHGCVETVRLLVEKAANVNAVGWNGCTALSLATESGQMDVVSLLLKAGADPSAQNKPLLTL